MQTARVLTQVAKELHSQCCEDEEEQHEEEAQVPHLQRNTRQPVSHLECPITVHHSMHLFILSL